MIIGAVLGIIGSVIPELFKLYKDKKEREYELQMFKMEMEKAELLGKIEIEKARALAQIELDKAIYDYAKPVLTPTGFKFADTLQAIGVFANTMVRPILTFLAFITLFCPDLLEVFKTYPQFADIYPDLLSGIIFFWFGNRSMQRALRNV